MLLTNLGRITEIFFFFRDSAAAIAGVFHRSKFALADMGKWNIVGAAVIAMQVGLGWTAQVPRIIGSGAAILTCMGHNKVPRATLFAKARSL